MKKFFNTKLKAFHNILDLFSQSASRSNNKVKINLNLTRGGDWTRYYNTPFREFCTTNTSTNGKGFKTLQDLYEYYVVFRNYPLVKLWLKSLIMGSLFLSITKILFAEYLTLNLRLYLLFIYTGVAVSFDLRERVKIPIAKVLEKLLGVEFCTHSDDLDKEELYWTGGIPEQSEHFKRMLYTIKFELVYYLQYLFQRLYIGLTYIRLFFDVNPMLYRVIYYSVIINIIYYDLGVIMPYIGIALIMSKLLVYFSENNFSEVKQNLTILGYNRELNEKKLELVKSNVMIILFWNIRDIDGTFQLKNKGFSIDDYEIGTQFIDNKNGIYHFCQIFFSKADLPFIYKDDYI